MAKSWVDSIKQARRLTVFNSLQGNWSALFQPSLTEFNNLLQASGITINLQSSTNASTANIVVGSGAGTVTFAYQGQSYSSTFSGNRLHGSTFLISVPTKIEKAYVFLPNNPQMNSPRGLRSTGVNVMKAILLHEFVHSCGLENSDHSSDDIFMGYPQTNPGMNAVQDKIGINTRQGYIWFPPFFLSSSTVAKINAVW